MSDRDRIEKELKKNWKRIKKRNEKELIKVQIEKGNKGPNRNWKK